MKKFPKDLLLYVLAYLIVLLVFGIVIYLIAYRPEMRDVISMAIGGIVGALITVVGFFFGSSKSSADKTVMLANKQTEQ